MGKALDLKDMTFGRLRVLERAQNRITKNGNSKRAWVCRCACGNVITATTMDLRSGDVKSCGCLKAELDVYRSLKHGWHGTHLHNVWCAMRRRCNDRRVADYCYYGGRGISVCDDWASNFMNFCAWAIDNGYEEGLTIDRIDVHKGYSPENCRWVDMKTQANNRSNSRYIKYRGENHTIKEWSEIIGVPYSTLYMRLRNGWDVDRALTTLL